MRILVVSDSHSDYFSLRKAVLAQPTASIIFHLGDCVEEFEKLMEEFPNKDFYRVRGNCDYFSNLPDKIIVTIEGKRILATHGHIHNVKSELETLYLAGKESEADIIVFGHTHVALTNYIDGIHLLNPGSIRGYKGTYGIIDITSAGIVTNTIEV